MLVVHEVIFPRGPSGASSASQSPHFSPFAHRRGKLSSFPQRLIEKYFLSDVPGVWKGKHSAYFNLKPDRWGPASSIPCLRQAGPEFLGRDTGQSWLLF